MIPIPEALMREILHQHRERLAPIVATCLAAKYGINMYPRHHLDGVRTTAKLITLAAYLPAEYLPKSLVELADHPSVVNLLGEPG